jgi:hypothetical protein
LPHRVLYLIDCRGYIADLDAWGDHVEELAQAGQGLVEAYEICNEPNVHNFWDWQPPDPARYIEMLCVAYERIEATDPEAAVVSAGLAPVGRIQGTCNGWNGNDCGAMDERTYARALLARGAGACMDAFGYHPYGFAYEPRRDPGAVENGFAFRGAEVMRQILLDYGLEDTPLWATEFNWLRDWTEDGGLPSWCHDFYETWFGWMEVSAEDQADYLVDAFAYADENWPWMHGMFVWNLDWHDYNTWDCQAARYYSVRRGDGSDLGASTPAYGALVAMEKRAGLFGPRLKIRPGTALLLADVHEPAVFTATTTVHNVGYRTLSWTAAADLASEIVPTLAVTSGVQGEPLEIGVDTAGLEVGVYTGAVTVTATTTDVLDSPQQALIEVHVVPEVWRIYLPAVLRGG